jgi:hypothetical protein
MGIFVEKFRNIYKERYFFVIKGGRQMEKSEGIKPLNLTYDDQGTNIVSEQIMDAYNSGVMDQENGEFVWKDSKPSIE